MRQFGLYVAGHFLIHNSPFDGFGSQHPSFTHIAPSKNLLNVNALLINALRGGLQVKNGLFNAG